MSDLAYDLARELGQLRLVAVENRKRAEAAEAQAAHYEYCAAEQNRQWQIVHLKLKALQEAAAQTCINIGVGRYRRASEILEAALAQSKE